MLMLQFTKGFQTMHAFNFGVQVDRSKYQSKTGVVTSRDPF